MGVAFGFILAHQRTLGPDQVYYGALLDQAAASGISPTTTQLALLGLARILVGKSKLGHQCCSQEPAAAVRHRL